MFPPITEFENISSDKGLFPGEKNLDPSNMMDQDKYLDPSNKMDLDFP